MASWLEWHVTSYVVDLARHVVGLTYARISAYGAGDEVLHIYFVHPDTPLPDNTSDEIKRKGTLYVPAEQFSWYLDVLRNEKPVMATLFFEIPINNKLRTWMEPIGEAE